MKRVCVFCGSKAGSGTAYLDAANELGRDIASRGIGLVYGGAAIGLMGALADAALNQGGEVIGVIPRSLVDREIAHPNLSQLHVVATMHERKALMERLSDAFIALPGGFGTLDELFEIITWRQLGLHHKVVGLLNVEGYFDPLLSAIRHAEQEGFVAESAQMLVAGTEASTLMSHLGFNDSRQK